MADLLRELGYSLQSNRKTQEGTTIPIAMPSSTTSTTAEGSVAAGEPAISVDTKKKELVGDFKNAGQEWRPQGSPEEVRVHDFVIPELGRAVPYGVYDIAGNTGWVSVGIDHDTAAFAVNAIRAWWRPMGRERYPNARSYLITADGGGSNGSRVRLWKLELQRLANEPACRSPSATCRPARANGTGSSIGCSRSSPTTGAANRSSAIKSSSN